MAKVTYKEPAEYFNADMKKAMKRYEEEKKAKEQAKKQTSGKKK